MQTLRTVHVGFDGFDMAFHGRWPLSVLGKLAEAKELAQQGEGESEATIMLAPDLPATVGRTGSKGGFAYSFKIEDVNFFAKNNPSEGWQLRVSVGSDMFLTYGGWTGVKEWLFYTLDVLGYVWSEESVGRVDFAIDVLAPEFILNPLHFVGHSRSKQSAVVGENGIQSCGGRCTGVTIGKQPGWQMCMYDKSKEVKEKGKEYWFQVWDVEATSKVWRMEMRIGKEALKKALGQKTLANVEVKLRELFIKQFQKVRLLSRACMDKENVTRVAVHPIWELAQKGVLNMFNGEKVAVKMTEIKAYVRQQRIEQAEKAIKGNIASYARLCGFESHEANDFLPLFIEKLSNEWKSENTQIRAKMKQAERRHNRILELKKVETGLC